ncbi:MAG TPA: arabinan endo-1,5-alpha-L-arabinosidase, partial [Candidatus Polarisedimenticolia bacterium]|nr:arabinan endo-1,5-alpha-L-arabinosidase [Candidatus Polarisedimenticolia bacterium]
MAAFLGIACVLASRWDAPAQMPVYGNYFAHDPSPMIKDGTNYFIYWTSQGIMGKKSSDLRNWTSTARVFPGKPPSWTTNAVPGFTGSFWAPDVIFRNGKYSLYYAISTFGTSDSAIGLATSPSLVSPTWTDQGPVIESASGTSKYNAIDPCALQDTNGTLWLVLGSYFGGIYITQLDPTTGKPINAANSTRISYNGTTGATSTEEGSFLYQRGGYYYLFVNWGVCCQGINST